MAGSLYKLTTLLCQPLGKHILLVLAALGSGSRGEMSPQGELA